MKKVIVFSIILVILLAGPHLLVLANGTETQNVEVLPADKTGTLTIVWGDPFPGSGGLAATDYFLTDDTGTTFELQFAAAHRCFLLVRWIRRKRHVAYFELKDAAATTRKPTLTSRRVGCNR